MTRVFVLQHVHSLDDGAEDVKFIRVYSSRENARAAITRLGQAPGFAEVPDGFHIDENQVDKDQWSKAFIARKCVTDWNRWRSPGSRSTMTAHEFRSLALRVFPKRWKAQAHMGHADFRIPQEDLRDARARRRLGDGQANDGRTSPVRPHRAGCLQAGQRRLGPSRLHLCASGSGDRAGRASSAHRGLARTARALGPGLRRPVVGSILSSSRKSVILRVSLPHGL